MMNSRWQAEGLAAILVLTSLAACGLGQSANEAGGPATLTGSDNMDVSVTVAQDDECREEEEREHAVWDPEEKTLTFRLQYGLSGITEYEVLGHQFEDDADLYIDFRRNIRQHDRCSTWYTATVSGFRPEEADKAETLHVKIVDPGVRSGTDPEAAGLVDSFVLPIVDPCTGSRTLADFACRCATLEDARNACDDRFWPPTCGAFLARLWESYRGEGATEQCSPADEVN